MTDKYLFVIGHFFREIIIFMQVMLVNKPTESFEASLTLNNKRAFQIEDLFFSLILIRNFRIPYSYSLKR